MFLLLTLDTIRRVPEQTNADNLTPQAIAGKHLWDRHNCMGCHTILGEGAYYAPELTKVYERRGPEFIEAMLTDPCEAMNSYPGQRRMVKYDSGTKGERGPCLPSGRPSQVDLAEMPDTQRLPARARLEVPVSRAERGVRTL